MQNPAVACQAQHMHPGKDTPCSDRIGVPAACATLPATRPFHFVHPAGVLWVHSTFFVPGDLDFWPWHSNSSEWRTKHVFHVNLAQIRSVVYALHCQTRVPRIERVSPISHIWCINGRQTISVKSGVNGPKFTIFLYDVDMISALLTHPSAFPYCHPLWNASPKKGGMSWISADFAPKFGCHGNFLDRYGNQYQIEHLHQHVYYSWKYGLVVSEISLLQAIV